MFLPTIILAALFGNQVDASASQQKWVTGRNATGLVDPNVSICTYWVNKISNATCKEVESHFDINFNQLHAWNPSLLKDYCTLIDGWSYCVEGPPVMKDTTANATAPKLFLPSESVSLGTKGTYSSSGTISSSTPTSTQNTGSASAIETSKMLIRLGLLVSSITSFW